MSASSSINAPRAGLMRITPGFMRATCACRRNPRVSSLSARCSEITSERISSSSSATRASPGRGVRFLRMYLHPQPAADAQNLAADTAQPDDAEGLADKLARLRVLTRCGNGPHGIHPRDVAQHASISAIAVPGNGGVAVALDGVDANAALRQPPDFIVSATELYVKPDLHVFAKVFEDCLKRSFRNQSVSGVCHPVPGDDDVPDFLVGTLCRCRSDAATSVVTDRWDFESPPFCHEA